MSRKKIRKKTS